MGIIKINGKLYGGPPAPITKLTQAEYNALPEAIRNKGIYVITDAEELVESKDAKDINYDDSNSGLGNNVQDAIDELNILLNNCFQSVSNGKTLIASAITDMGVETDATATFEVMAEHIENIEAGIDTTDATATAADITEGKTAYANGQLIVGIRPAAPKTLSGSWAGHTGEGYKDIPLQFKFNPPFDKIPTITFTFNGNRTTCTVKETTRDYVIFNLYHSHGNESHYCTLSWTATVQ